MAAVLLPVLVLFAALVVVAVLAKRFLGREQEQGARLQDSHRPTLRYLVPPGQDPAVVLLALSHAGYDASPDSGGGGSSPIVIIGRRDGQAPDREGVRATLALESGTNINPEESGPVERRRVLFEDEYSQGHQP